jgi:hypothetical protein
VTAAAAPCIGEPISWLRLEQLALAPPDAADSAISAHLATCPACQQCLDQIRGDAVALPPLVAPPVAPRARRPAWRRRWLAPALAALAAVAILVVVLRPVPARHDALGPVAIKGVGEVALELVRERGGAIAVDARHYAPGDRWKIVVSCPPAAGAAMLALDVSVADGAAIDHPLAAARIACGNRVVVPGAFAITGDRPNRVCVWIGPAAAAGVEPASAATACATLVPEPGPEPAR